MAEEKNPRDTQFAGFAKLLLKDWRNTGEFWIDTADNDLYEQWELLIARRAYDLVEHTVDSCVDQEDSYESRIMPDFLLRNVPDLTKWPEVEEEKK